MGMGNGFAEACVKLPHVHNHLPIVHPVDSRQGDHEVASVLDIDDERVGIGHVPADGAELLASLDRIDLEATLDVAVLRHAGSSSMEKRQIMCHPCVYFLYQGHPLQDPEARGLLYRGVRQTPVAFLEIVSLVCMMGGFLFIGTLVRGSPLSMFNPFWYCGLICSGRPCLILQVPCDQPILPVQSSAPHGLRAWRDPHWIFSEILLNAPRASTVPGSRKRRKPCRRSCD